MRILYLSPWFPYPLDTGFRIRVYHMLRAMAQDHRVTLLTLDPQGWALAETDAVDPFCERAVLVPRDPFRRGWLRNATRFFALRPVVAAPFPEMTRMVSRMHAEKPFDVVVASSVAMASYALAIPGVPRILEEHNSHTRWMHDRYQAQTSPLQRLRCWVSWHKSALYESILFRRFDLVTMASDLDLEVSQRLLAQEGTPVVLVPNGVDCEDFRPGLASPQAERLVFSGALGYDANYEAMAHFLSEVYPRVRQRCPGAHLRITGSTRDVDLDNLPLDESVTLTGFVEDVRTEIAGAWISVVPIRSGGGTRIKILEAMALGTPVVSTSKGAEGLDVTSGEDILIADEPAEFAERITCLLRDASLRQRLVARARCLVERRYDWAEIGQRFVSLIEDVVKDNVEESRRGQ